MEALNEEEGENQPPMPDPIEKGRIVVYMKSVKHYKASGY